MKTFYLYLGNIRSSSLARNIIKVCGGDLLSRVFSVGTAILIIRGLPVNDYAAYTAFFNIVVLFSQLVGSGVNSALVTFSAEHISKTKRKPFELYFASFFLQLILYTVLSVVSLLFMDRITNMFFGSKNFDSSFYYGLIGGLGLLVSNAGRRIYQAEEKYGTYVRTLWLRQSMAFTMIFLLFIFKKLDFSYAAQAIIFVEICIALIITIHIYKSTSIKELVKFLKNSTNIIKDFFISTRWLIAYFFMIVSFQRLDVFMLSHFSSEEEIANYGVAFRYYSLALILLTSIHTVLLPKFSNIDMQDFFKQRQFMFKWLKIMVWLLVPIIIVDLFGKPLFIWVSGEQYGRAFNILMVFSVGIWLSLMFSPLVNIMISRKEFKFLFFLGLSAFLFNFMGNYLLIPVFGGLGAALITILSHALINIPSGARIFFSKK